MSADVSVSVVVPVLNGAATICDLLRGLSAQVGAPAGVEIIVVDNGSTDGTPEAARAMRARVVHEPRRGPSAARNRGCAETHGDVVAFIDADMVPSRRWLAELCAPFCDAAAIVAGGYTEFFPPTTAAESFSTQLGTRRLEYHLFRQRFAYAGSGNIAVRRPALESVGGWDESFLTAEDFDLCIRLSRRFGRAVVRQPLAIAFHRQRQTPDALRRQAWGHGQGLGKIHLEHPDVLPMGARQWAQVASTLAARRARASVIPARKALRLADADSADFARHHWLWSEWLWRGFASMIRHKEWRPL